MLTLILQEQPGAPSSQPALMWHWGLPVVVVGGQMKSSGVSFDHPPGHIKAPGIRFNGSVDV